MKDKTCPNCIVYEDGRCKPKDRPVSDWHYCEDFDDGQGKVEEIEEGEGTDFDSETEGYSDVEDTTGETLGSCKDLKIMPLAEGLRYGVRDQKSDDNDLQWIKDLMDGAEKVIIYRKSGLKATLEFNQKEGV
jgi:hypothetical protein